MELEPDAALPLQRARSVRVKGLFGLYDHTIDLNLDERVTIIHGPNGVGKTKILQMVAALFGGDLRLFLRVEFESFRVEFLDGTELELSVVPRDSGRGGESPGRRNDRLALALFSGVEVARAYFPDEQEFAWLSLEEMQDLMTGDADRHGGGALAESLEGVKHLLRGGQRKPSDKFSGAFPRSLSGPGAPQIASALGSVGTHVIGAQRLLTQADSTSPGEAGPLVPTVAEYSGELRRRIQEDLARYASVSQRLDQSIPQRLLWPVNDVLSWGVLKERLLEIEKRRQRYVVLGLLDELGPPLPDLTSLDGVQSAQAGILTLYVRDTDAKLRVLEDLARRIEILLAGVNGKFSNKRVRVDQHKGLVAETAGGVPLNLNDLSSGEQQEIVLLYDLLFNVRPNTLVLIDEPELSLHVVWQKRFLHDLLQIARTANFDALVATHSPFIVSDRDDLLVDLSATVN